MILFHNRRRERAREERAAFDAHALLERYRDEHRTDLAAFTLPGAYALEIGHVGDLLVISYEIITRLSCIQARPGTIQAFRLRDLNMIQLHRGEPPGHGINASTAEKPDQVKLILDTGTTIGFFCPHGAGQGLILALLEKLEVALAEAALAEAALAEAAAGRGGTTPDA